MEPMTLGSPTGSPASTPYLPSFLMGEPHTPNPRNNTLSPNKTGARNVSFGFTNTPTTGSGSGGGHTAVSPTDYNRSLLNQKTLFSNSYQQTPPLGLQNTNNYTGTPQGAPAAAATGPPTQGLFDSLRNERNQIQSPRSCNTTGLQQQMGTPCGAQMNISYQMNQSMQQQHQHQQQHPLSNTSALYNDSLLSNPNNSFNLTRTTPMPHIIPVGTICANNTNLNNTPLRYAEFWVTVYGFPTTATATILQHFSQCGTIIDKVFPSQNGNWVHLKYSSRLECERALNYNEKILANNIMIGVTMCKDKNIVDKENICDNMVENRKVRSLAQTAYKNEISVAPTNCAAHKSSGLVNKALDLFFGW